MNYYFAPLEGITGYIYRNTYEKHFGGISKYFTPFITTNQHFTIQNREKKDILPENNQGIYLVPQILTNNAEQFVDMARKIQDLGYKEINLNLGCPSRTVVTKKKGSGFLSGDTNVLYKMKEHWYYLFISLPGSEKAAKAMKKTRNLDDYRILVKSILRG